MGDTIHSPQSLQKSTLKVIGSRCEDSAAFVSVENSLSVFPPTALPLVSCMYSNKQREIHSKRTKIPPKLRINFKPLNGQNKSVAFESVPTLNPHCTLP